MAPWGVGGAMPMALMVASAVVLCYGLFAFLALPRMLQLDTGCRMSYMYPSYVSHNKQLRQHTRSTSPVLRKYSLLEYRENDARKHALGKKHAMAALFVPGNAGSYGQVRSIASSTANQYWVTTAEGATPDRDKVQDEWQGAPGPVDWYTLDFHEDFSAFHGATLEDQAYFVNEAVDYLRALYPSPDDGQLREGERNTTVTLVAHSMGGIAARLAPRLANYVPRSIDTIVTLSTPHAFPPVPFDRSVDRVYDRVNRGPARTDEEPPLLISIAGGLLDTQLSSDAASLRLAQIQSPESRLTAFTSAVPLLWSSVDHLASVWCDQLRSQIARGLLIEYKNFGNLAEQRAQPEVRLQRHALWRRLLAPALDAAPEEEIVMDARTANLGDESFRGLTPSFERTTSGDQSVFGKQPGTAVYPLLRAPGPRATHDGHVQPNEELAFELLTNLGVGASPTTGNPVGQDIELVVMVCRRSGSHSIPTKLDRAYCQAVMPARYETLPPSQTPNTTTPPFPNPNLLYEVPTASIKRLHLSATFMRENHVEMVRIERRLGEGKYTGPTSQHKQTLFTAGWREDEPVELRGAPRIGRRVWALPGLDLAPLLSTRTEAGHGPQWVWHWPDLDASLLAYEVELVPAACSLRFKYPLPPRTAPIVRVTNLGTNDARLYPSLDVRTSVRFPMALHGSAPYIPPAAAPQRGTLLELWVPDTFDTTLFSNTNNLECPLPYGSVRVRVLWRASAALLVLRYRFALLVWPMAVLAMAYLNSRTMPVEALSKLATWPQMGRLLGAPVAVHLLAAAAHGAGIPGRWYTLGIGMTDLHYLLLGPLLMLLAYGFAMILALFSELMQHGVHVVLQRYASARLDRWLDMSMPVEAYWPASSVWSTWAKARSTWLAGALLLACWIFLPYQVLTLACFLLHSVTVTRSYMAWQRAEQQPRMPPEAWERHVAPHETQRARTLRALESMYAEHAWLNLFLAWLLPLQMPILVVWVRNVNAGVKMGMMRTEHQVLASMFLLALVYMYANALRFPKIERPWVGQGTRLVYTLLCVASVVYGIRFAYVQAEVFQLVLAWEVGRRCYALYAQPTVHLASEEGEETEIFVLEPLHSTVPAALTADRRQAKLDTLWEEYLETLDAYLAARRAVATSLSTGFADLARAKMALGGEFGLRLSENAYDARMRACVRMQDGQLASTTTPPPAPPAEVGGLRRRTTADTPKDIPPANEPRSEGRVVLGFDPLYQFSGMPPPALRSAQRAFREALRALVDNGHANGPPVLAWEQRLEALEKLIQAERVQQDGVDE